MIVVAGVFVVIVVVAAGIFVMTVVVVAAGIFVMTVVVVAAGIFVMTVVVVATGIFVMTVVGDFVFVAVGDRVSMVGITLGSFVAKTDGKYELGKKLGI